MREFPIQGETMPGDRRRRLPGGTIPWEVAEVVYAGYAERNGRSQSLERLAERGGFSWGEVAMHYADGRRVLADRALR